MKRIDYALLAMFVLMVTVVLFWSCAQQEGSNPESVLNTQGGDLGGVDEECSITVPEPEPEDLSSLAQITAEQARDAALSLYPESAVLEVELENEDGCLVYEVELSNGLEIVIDAGNAEVLEVESEDDDEEGDHEDDDDDDDDSGGGK